jgi:hypothetical protein
VHIPAIWRLATWFNEPLTTGSPMAVMVRISFDHLIDDREQIRRYFEAKRFRRLEIDSQLKFGWLEDGNIAPFRPFQDLVNHVGGAVAEVRKVNPVGHQPPDFDEQLKWVHRWQLTVLSQFNDQLVVRDVFRIVNHHDSIGMILDCDVKYAAISASSIGGSSGGPTGVVLVLREPSRS